MTAAAFKEWHAIVEALGTGRQSIILRKGGIAEGRGGFRPDHARFWLYPTGFHQTNRGLLRPAAPLPAGTGIPVRYLAELCGCARVDDPVILSALRAFHEWSHFEVEQKFTQGKWNGLLVLLVRVYALPAPVVLPDDPAYGGCKSWITLANPVPETDLTPVLSDAEHTTRTKNIRALLPVGE